MIAHGMTQQQWYDSMQLARNKRKIPAMKRKLEEWARGWTLIAWSRRRSVYWTYSSLDRSCCTQHPWFQPNTGPLVPSWPSLEGLPYPTTGSTIRRLRRAKD